MPALLAQLMAVYNVLQALRVLPVHLDIIYRAEKVVSYAQIH
jgi:hypothetical protein